MEYSLMHSLLQVKDPKRITKVATSVNLYSFFNHGPEPLILSYIDQRIEANNNHENRIKALNKSIANDLSMDSRLVTRSLENLEACGIIKRTKSSDNIHTTVDIDLTFVAFIALLPPDKIIRFHSCTPVEGFSCKIPALQYHQANVGHPPIGYDLRTSYTMRMQPKYELMKIER